MVVRNTDSGDTCLPMSPKSALLALFGVMLVGALLGVVRPLASLSVPMIGVLVVVLAWIVYQYLEPIRLMRRHAILSHVMPETSRLRRFLWKGHLLRIALAFGAVSASFLAVALSASFSSIEWGVLLGGLPVFALTAVSVYRRVAQDVVSEYRFAFTLRFASRIHLTLMVAVLVLIQVFFLGVPVTAHESTIDLLNNTWREESTSAADPSIGWLLGAGVAIDRGVWHLIQISAPGEGAGWLIYLIACVALLIWKALSLACVWMVFLGVIALVHAQQHAGWRVLGNGPTAVAFSLVLFVMFVAYVALTQINVGTWIQTAQEEGAIPRECETVPASLREAGAEQARAALSERYQYVNEQIAVLIAHGVREAYEAAEAGVDRFLDWNFSLGGQYQQLLFMGRSVLPDAVGFERFVAGKIDEFVNAEIGPAIESVRDGLSVTLDDTFSEVFRAQAALVQHLVGEMDCLDPPSPDYSFEEFMHKNLVGAGSGAGILAARIGSGLGARVVGRSAVKRTFGAVFSRLASKVALSSGAGSAGAVCGPFAPVCIPALALGAWLGTDLIITSIDEALNREQMKAEMMSVLAADREELERALTEYYQQFAANIFVTVEDWQNERFNIYRDGVRGRD